MKEKRTIQTVQKSIAAFFRENRRMPSFAEMVGLLGVSVYVQAKSEKIFSFGVTHYLRCLRQAFFHKSECLLPLGQAQ